MLGPDDLAFDEPPGDRQIPAGRHCSRRRDRGWFERQTVLVLEVAVYSLGEVAERATKPASSDLISGGPGGSPAGPLLLPPAWPIVGAGSLSFPSTVLISAPDPAP